MAQLGVPARVSQEVVFKLPARVVVSSEGSSCGRLASTLVPVFVARPDPSPGLLLSFPSDTATGLPQGEPSRREREEKAPEAAATAFL